MGLLNLERKGGYLAFDEAQCAAAGAALHERYIAAEPFPHIVIDDFLDRSLLVDIVENYPSREGKSYFDRSQERLKYQYHAGDIDHGHTLNILSELNSRAFIAFLRELTGIKGLIADPYFSGGGLHETCNGGHLSIHADFNIHGVMKVERRLNLLIYLNEDWPEEFGGQLELWDKQMQKPVVEIAPLLGRAVIFNTSLDSYHGQPDPVSCPETRSRRSIATYYYTAFDNLIDAPVRTTNFRARPNSADKPDREIGFNHFVFDWVPPRLQKFALRLNPWRAR
jgi:Rps23 Pro-64 3,4-dihydroxylase Tpa1-like proline 4-hydroxylase